MIQTFNNATLTQKASKLLLQYMQQETKVRYNKRKPLDLLEVCDSQCGFLKML